MAEVTICSDFETKKIKFVTVSIVSPPICHEVTRLDVMFLVYYYYFLILKFMSCVPSFTFIKRLFSSSSFSTIRVVSSAYLSCCYFSWQSLSQLVLYSPWNFIWYSLWMCKISRWPHTHDLAMEFFKVLIKKTHAPQHSLKHTVHQDMEATWMSIRRYMNGYHVFIYLSEKDK